MDDKKIYDIVMESERQENLMLTAQNNREREQHGDKDYLSVAAEACEKFNSEFEGQIDALSKEDVYRPAELGAAKTMQKAKQFILAK